MTDRAEFRRLSDEEIHELFIDYKEHKEQSTYDRKQLIQCMDENKKAIQKLTELQTKSINSTKGLVEGWEAASGAIKVLVVIGKIIKWGVGVGGPIYGLYLFLKHSGKVG